MFCVKPKKLDFFKLSANNEHIDKCVAALLI
jgi:hypothetical protein